MTRWRRTLTTTATTGALLVAVSSQALALGSLLDPIASLVEADAAAAVAGATDWSDAVATYLTSPLDTSDEAARYDDPFLLNWPTFVPAYPGTEYTPGTERDCQRGKIQCVESVIREMTRRYDALGCDHDAAFALTYLRTTEEYKRYWETGAFDEPEWLNHYDAVFAQFYFDAYDSWYKRGGADTPPAWRVAFEASESRSVSGMGNVMLGMVGHIRRDLPFVLEAIGLTNPDGTTRKADHNRVNEFLNAVQYTVMGEVAERHDPSIDDGDVPYLTMDNGAALHAIMEWREEAWRKAELLLGAPTPAERDRIARWIENEAAATAIAVATLYEQPDSAARDAYCASALANS